MTVYKITSRVLENGKIRTEYIDTNKNEIFRKAKTAKDVKDWHEGFWNINSPQVKVISVEKVRVSSKGKNWGIKFHKAKDLFGGVF